MSDIMERIRSRVIETSSGCWEWQGATVGNGYACIRINGRTHLVHRVVLGDQVGPDQQVDHLCRNIRCVRRDHLEPVSQQENIRRQFAATPSATHCQRSHEFTPENTGRNSAGGRFCIACDKELRRVRDRERYLARKAATCAS